MNVNLKSELIPRAKRVGSTLFDLFNIDLAEFLSLRPIRKGAQVPGWFI